MKKWIKVVLFIFAIIAIVWTGMTIWVEIAGKQQKVQYKLIYVKEKALIVYNPDPIYNLDEQVCKAIADELKDHKINATVVTNKRINEVSDQDFDIFFFCANTYNFAPDRGIRSAIKKIKRQPSTPTVAITLGAGTTRGAQKRFERFLAKHDYNVVESETYWLLRPNDEGRMEEPNALVATDQARALAKKSLTHMTLPLKEN